MNTIDSKSNCTSLPYDIEFPAVFYQFKHIRKKNLGIVIMMDFNQWKLLGIFFGKFDQNLMDVYRGNEGCHVIKKKDNDAKPRFDIKFKDENGYEHTMEGLSRAFNNNLVNLAKSLSTIIRLGATTEQVCKSVSDLDLGKEFTNFIIESIWKADGEITRRYEEVNPTIFSVLDTA